MKNQIISGSIVALVTPFTKENKIDISAIKNLVEFHIKGGTDIIIPCGTTGESPALSEEEQKLVIETVVETAGNKITIMGGAGSNNTEHAVKLSKQAERAGVKGILSVAPYYNKPTQEGYVRHYSEIASSVHLPIILYNVPGRTGGNMEVDTMLRICDKNQNVTCIKEASGNMNQVMELLRSAPASVSVLSGDDPLGLPMMALGAKGIISVAANFIPSVVKAMIAFALEGNIVKAREIHNQYLHLFQLNFIESNPIPVKYILSRMKMVEEIYRLPIVPISKQAKEKVDVEIKRLKIISE